MTKLCVKSCREEPCAHQRILKSLETSLDRFCSVCSIIVPWFIPEHEIHKLESIYDFSLIDRARQSIHIENAYCFAKAALRNNIESPAGAQ